MIPTRVYPIAAWAFKARPRTSAASRASTASSARRSSAPWRCAASSWAYYGPRTACASSDLRRAPAEPNSTSPQGGACGCGRVVARPRAPRDVRLPRGCCVLPRTRSQIDGLRGPRVRLVRDLSWLEGPGTRWRCDCCALLAEVIDQDELSFVVKKSQGGDVSGRTVI